MQLSRRPFFAATALAGIGLLAGIVLIAATASISCPGGPLARMGPALSPPSPQLLGGADDIGRSVLCMTTYGLRTSLIIGSGSGALALALGILIGAFAGVVGGWPDILLMRLTEVIQTMPRLFLAILAAALFELKIAGLILVLGLTSWGVLARVVRAEAISLSAREFVLAARALGVTSTRIVLRHGLPNLYRPFLATAGPTIAGAILAEAALAYVGLGDQDAVSLGRMIADAYSFLGIAWWMSVVPMAALVLVTLSFLLLSEAAEDR
jgi:peptide/nickel transport system permease protein